MTIVNFCGYDGMGKTTLISQILSNYTNLYATAFPSDVTLCDKKYSIDNITEILEYHNAYLADFHKNQQILKEINDVGSLTTLLDRYFYCNTAYLLKDIMKYCKNQEVDYKDLERRIHRDIIEPRVELYKILLQPDLVIYLHGSSLKKEQEDEEYTMVDKGYRTIFEYFKPKDLRYVESLRGDTTRTFKEVERILLEKEYVKHK